MTTPALQSSAVVDAETAPRVAELREIFQRDYRFFKDVVDRAWQNFGPTWLGECEESLSRVFPSSESLTLAVKGYAYFVLDVMRRQVQFERERSYPNKTYDEAAQEVYLDERYMRDEYLPGVLLSHFLWRHQWQQVRFFATAFAAQAQLRSPSRFAEIGVGTGLYSRRMLQHVPSVRGTGFDISPASKAYTEQHVRAFGFEDRYEVILADIATQSVEPFDWIICVEVLEHLEDPVLFLRALRERLAPNGRAFITAALNAAQVDHIYLYETAEQVLSDLQEAGFALEQGFMAVPYPPTTPGSPVPGIATFIVE